jgi:hypothetical protein
MDMITDEAECEKAAAELAGGEKVWWMPPGWVRFRKLVFKGWDKGLANENFPRHAGGDKPRPYRKLPHIQCRPPEKLLCICNSDIECKGAIIVEPIDDDLVIIGGCHAAQNTRLFRLRLRRRVI